MKHKAEFTLGLLGGVLGILSGILIMKTDLFKVVAGDKEGALLTGMFVILCSVFAVIASLFIEHKPREAGMMFLVSGALGLLISSFLYAVQFVLLLIAGILALTKTKNE
ncbi:MAG: DUF4064 domain-containing protein [Thermosipho sp. (in: Bacteria)]|nr:DUF4064 domain-containing protein [Thermosipho sp. (in: thermotogales)]